MKCPVKSTNEISGLNGVVRSFMTRCGHRVDERSRTGGGMKLQDVMLRARAKRITGFQAAKIVGMRKASNRPGGRLGQNSR
jgi:hypothetical protein